MNNTLRRIYIFFLSYIFSVISLSAQLPSYLLIQLESSEEKKLERAKRFFDDADAAMKAAVSLYESIPATDTALGDDMIMKYEEALFHLHTASRYIKNGMKLTYSILEKGMDDFWEKHNIRRNYFDIMKEAVQMEQIARDDYISSVSLRDQLAEVSDFLFGIKLHNLAHKHEVYTLNYGGRALQIYQEYPIEYPHNWSNQFVFNLITLNPKAFEKKNEQHVNSKELDQIQVVTFVKDPVTNEKDTAEIQYDIHFRVQVAAHVSRIPKIRLQEIYDGDRYVEEVKEEGWWKYQIGHYKSYSSAQAILEEVDVDRAFITAYNYGKKINISLAKKISP
jgi:hypothetical protein